MDAEAPLPGALDPWAGSQLPPLRDGPPYLMTEMIAAEPAVSERILRRLSTGAGARTVDEVAGMVHDAVRRGRPVVTTGCGTSEHAAMAAAWLLADALEPAEQWLVRSRQALDVVRQPVAEGALIAISHEGGTWATNEALRAVRPEHVSRALISVSNRSPGAALAAAVIETGEQDQSWCHTVGYLSPLVAAAAAGVPPEGKPPGRGERPRPAGGSRRAVRRSGIGERRAGERGADRHRGHGSR